MSLNKYMHPRNIYKTPPNFKQLAIEYPEFRAYIIQDVSGKVTIDFKDIKTLRALTCTLLKNDFGLDVDIPLSRMIPTVPLRLNYILWIEDLLSISGNVNNVYGIDVGTGASCIYPLLAAKSKRWRMIGTDVDLESLNYAQANVDKNSLNNLIALKKISDGTLLKEAVGNDSLQQFDFCMCNPPFFASSNELNPSHKARRPDRPRPRNAFCATLGEVVADGGEVNFIKKMIEESKVLDKRIRIYTSMVGHKSNLPALKKLLREADVVSFKQTEFYQGHTARWGLAWTFHDIDLRAVPEATVLAAKKAKSKTPLQHVVPSSNLPINAITDKLKEIFLTLCMDCAVLKESKNVAGFCVTARSNTWAHQRRRRREQMRANVVFSLDDNDDWCKYHPPTPSPSSTNSDVQDTSELVAKLKVESPKSAASKRELEEDGFYNSKRFKLTDGDDCYLKTSIVVRKEADDFVIELLYLEGSAGKEGLHQVLQYIKNYLKLE